MKKRKTGIFIICCLVFSLFISIFTVMAKDTSTSSTEITREQLEAQVNLFKNALDKFGATEPLEAANLYALGFKERNGVYQYSVLCDILKESFIKEMGEPSKSFWVIGVSSPWLEDYTILEDKKLNDNTHEIKLKLHWVASGNYNEYEEKLLTITRQQDKWCISSIK
ncbi:MAG: hypothetical protein AB6733_01335 [Clostridiaceae bacterium]